jgi:hypothetical protein
MENTFGINSVLNFNSSATGNMRACLPVIDDSGEYIARWNDTIPSDQDYDFFFYDSNMTDYVNSGAAPQSGTNNDLPREKFSAITGEPGCLVVGSFNSTENHKFHIEVGSNGINNQLNIPDDDPNRLGSIDTPADSISSLAVGAINFNSSPTNYLDDSLESFSSRGPTDDGRLKPEICGPDRTVTDQTVVTGGSSMFAGTSASTPHIAGAAALLLENDQSLTAEQLKQKLIDNARFDADFSQDNLCGSDSGSLALSVVPSCQNVPTSGTWTLEETCVLRTNSAMDSLIIQNSSSLTINPNVTLDLTSPNTLTLKSGSSLLIKSGASLTYTGSSTCEPPDSGDWIVTSDCIMSSSDVVLGNVIVQDGSTLTIPSGIFLDVDFANFQLIIKTDGSILIKSGGELK